MEESFFQFTLDNGIRVIHQQFDDAQVSHFGVLIKVGSRDETIDQQGLAHFIEHCIFKGTTRRKPFHILNRLDSVGGELNAYTTKEEICIYGSFLNKYYSRAIELISDILFNSTFPEKELVKEKDVIIDEIHSYQDSPAELIFDDFEEQVFNNHSIGWNILGTEESVKSLNRNHIIDFLKNSISGNDIVLSSAGNIPEKKLQNLIVKSFDVAIPSNNKMKRKAFSKYVPERNRVSKQTHQVHTVIGNLTYGLDNDKRRQLILLNNILGGPSMNSRLNLNIREKYGLTYSIDSSYAAYSDVGLFNVYFSCEPQYYNKIMKLVNKEFDKLKNQKLGVNQLSQAKIQLKGNISLAQENRSSVMLSLGKSLLYFDKIASMREIFNEIDSISSRDIQSISNEVFVNDNMSELVFDS